MIDMKTDWNSNGKHDWTDDYMDYKLSSDENSTHSSERCHSSGGHSSKRIPTWLLIAVLLGIISGELPINVLTVVLACIIAVAIWIRLIT